MPVSIEYRPRDLIYSDFLPVDRECFPDEPMDEATFRAFLSEDFWAAMDSGHFVGYCYLQRKPDFFWLRRCGVEGHHRRGGIGRLLMKSALEHCRTVGGGEVILYVESENAPAVGLYESFGFSPVEATYQYEAEVSRIRSSAETTTESLEAVPIDQAPPGSVPQFPKQWSDIRRLHGPPGQYVFVFVGPGGAPQGYCRLTPSFPGVFPFEVSQPQQNLSAALHALLPYLLPDKAVLKLTFGDPAIELECRASQGFRFVYKLYKMVLTLEAASRERK